MQAIKVVVIAALAACNLQMGSSSGSGTTPGGGGGGGNPPTNAREAPESNDEEAHMSTDGKMMRRIPKLVGMTPDQARAQIAAWGQELGREYKVTVFTSTNTGGGAIYDEKCGDNRVCSVEPSLVSDRGETFVQFTVNGPRLP